jgi:hypothetical protein
VPRSTSPVTGNLLTSLSRARMVCWRIIYKNESAQQGSVNRIRMDLQKSDYRPILAQRLPVRILRRKVASFCREIADLRADEFSNAHELGLRLALYG